MRKKCPKFAEIPPIGGIFLAQRANRGYFFRRKKTCLPMGRAARRAPAAHLPCLGGPKGHAWMMHDLPAHRWVGGCLPALRPEGPAGWFKRKESNQRKEKEICSST